MKQYSYVFAIIAFFGLMLSFPQATFVGASNGLLLWFQTILPTLLPFIILSNILIHTNSVYYLSKILKPFIQRIFQVSETASYAVVVGFLCGYPMGAKVIADLIASKRITLQEGRYLLSFCNNTSPMFIISFIVMQNFNEKFLSISTLSILLLSPVLCSFLFRKWYRPNKVLCAATFETDRKIYFNFNIFDTCIMNGFETITKVGGYMILFSVLFSLGSKLPITWLLPVLEISNGIPCIMRLGAPLTITFPWVLALTSFGGLCSVAQTYSMIQKTGLSIVSYIIQKLITSLVTSFLAIIYIQFIHQ